MPDTATSKPRHSTFTCPAAICWLRWRIPWTTSTPSSAPPSLEHSDIGAATSIALAPYASRIDLSRSDCRPRLTKNELKIARRWAEGVVITRRQLPRLYAPIADVLLHDGRDRVNRLRSVKLILMEVGRSGKAYWGWDEQYWIDLIDQTQVLPNTAMVPQLTAVAYLLCGVRRFYDLKRNITLAATARLVFGPEVFNPEAERLMAALERVGFKCSTLHSFMPLPPLPSSRQPTQAGQAAFTLAGCGGCHVPALPGANGRMVPLYSDLLLHDMGPALDDGVEQGTASGAHWRTPPLWGLGARHRLLHDGRATNVSAAISAHEGEGASAAAFWRLSSEQRHVLLTFLGDL